MHAGTPVQASLDHPSSSGDPLSAPWLPVHVVKSLCTIPTVTWGQGNKPRVLNAAFSTYNLKKWQAGCKGKQSDRHLNGCKRNTRQKIFNDRQHSLQMQEAHCETILIHEMRLFNLTTL